MRECEEDDVLDGAAVAGAVEGAACWCRVAHLADVVRDCSLVLRRCEGLPTGIEDKLLS